MNSGPDGFLLSLPFSGSIGEQCCCRGKLRQQSIGNASVVSSGGPTERCMRKVGRASAVPRFRVTRRFPDGDVTDWQRPLRPAQIDHPGKRLNGPGGLPLSRLLFSPHGQIAWTASPRDMPHQESPAAGSRGLTNHWSPGSESTRYGVMLPRFPSSALLNNVSWCCDGWRRGGFRL